MGRGSGEREEGRGGGRWPRTAPTKKSILTRPQNALFLWLDGGRRQVVKPKKKSILRPFQNALFLWGQAEGS